MTTRTCEEIRELLPHFADGAVGEAEGRRIREHVEACPECRREAERWSALNRVLTEGLRAEEAVPAGTVEEALRRVREVRPAWRAAPAPVRFWRTWAPTGALALTAAVIGLVGLYSPWLDLHDAPAVLRAEVAAVASETADIGAIVPRDVSALDESVRSWPQDVRAEVVERWDDGTALAQSVLSRTGPAPLAVGGVLLLVVNLACARGAVGARQSLQEGS